MTETSKNQRKKSLLGQLNALEVGEEHHDVALVENEERSIYITIVGGSYFIETILYVLYKFLAHSVLHLQHIKHIVYLLLCSCFQGAVEREEIIFVNQYSPF